MNSKNILFMSENSVTTKKNYKLFEFELGLLF